MSKQHKIIASLSIMTIVLSLSYILLPMTSGFNQYIFTTRTMRIFTMLLVSVSIGTATVIFQTIVNNRIITPSIIGFDSLFILIQTVLILLFSGTSYLIINDFLNFIVSTIIMLVCSGLLFTWYLKHKNMSIFNFLLIAMVFSMLINSFNSFLTLIIDPNEYFFIQDESFASFNILNFNLIMISAIVVIIALIYVIKNSKALDVLFLGHDQALNLGIDFKKFSYRMFLVVALLISVSTALVGPILFLGFIVVNIAKQHVKNHVQLIIMTTLIGQILLVITFWISQEIFNFGLPQIILINLIGAFYFLFIILREHYD